jgi:hypothetical protein
MCPLRWSAWAEPRAEAPEDLELVGAGEFKLDPFAHDGSGVLLAVLVDGAFIEPVHELGPARFRHRAHEFHQNPPMREETTFKRKVQRRDGSKGLLAGHGGRTFCRC